MQLDKNFLYEKIKQLKLTENIIDDIIESYQLLKSFYWSNNKIILSQYNTFIDFFCFPLLESFLENKKNKSRLYVRLAEINVEAQSIFILFWFLCFRDLDLEMMDRIFHKKDYNMFWYQYANWLEKNINTKTTEIESAIALYLQNRAFSLKEINVKEWLNIEELSIYTRIARGTLYNYVSNGEIPHTKKGGLKFNREEIDNWLKSKSFNPDDIRKQIKKKGLL